MGSNVDLFTIIMEADDIPDFDAGADLSAATDTPIEPDATSNPDDGGSGSSEQDAPPEMNDSGMDDFGFNPDEGGGEDPNETGEDNPTDDTGGNDADEDNVEGKKLGAKTNDILNERLYRRLTERNAEVETDLKQIQQVLSVLPYEIAESDRMERLINQLKTALSKGQSYAIDNFVSSEYGVNLTFFEKLNALYALIEDSIDKEIRKANKE